MAVGYLNIVDALNAGIEKLVSNMPDTDKAEIAFKPAATISEGFDVLSEILMAHSVRDAKKALELHQAYQSVQLNNATAIAKFLDAIVELHKKANPVAQPVNPKINSGSNNAIEVEKEIDEAE